MKLVYLNFILTTIFCLASCEKFVEVDPPQNQLVSASVFKTVESADAALIGIYSQMVESVNSNTFPNGYPTVLGGLSSDELVDATAGAGIANGYKEIADNNILPLNLEIQNFWNQGYRYINYANAIIEGLITSTTINANDKLRLSGEAYFIRAWCHYYLMSFFGGVPYITVSDYQENIAASRISEADDLDKMIIDLKQAETEMAQTDFTGLRNRPTAWVAKALLAKIYLLKKDWANAALYSDQLITNTDFELAPEVESVFNKESKEIIWQLTPVVPPNFVVEDAAWFIPLPGANPTMVISPALMAAFEPNDARESEWLDSVDVSGTFLYYPYKYRINNQLNDEQYYVVFRLAEQYLIRAEAKLNNGDTEGALSDVNIIRARALLPALALSDPADILNAVWQERRIELFAEWGNRWIDLKRSGKIDEVMTAIKGSSWQSEDSLYPIPQAEILVDRNLSQNPGY